MRVSAQDINEQIQGIDDFLKTERTRQATALKKQQKKITEGHPLPQGILKTVKVYVAIKRNLQVGDKMAGRHGNKGVVSKIVPAESMPYMQDGTPVDIVLSPLGVPSRMNVGQILETHLGLAARGTRRQNTGNVATGTRQTDGENSRVSERSVRRGRRRFLTLPFLSDEEVLETASNLQKGVPFATPIFDGATERGHSPDVCRSPICPLPDR